MGLLGIVFTAVVMLALVMALDSQEPGDFIARFVTLVVAITVTVSPVIVIVYLVKLTGGF